MRRSVASFGSFEYWFAMIKVVAIVLFIAFGSALHCSASVRVPAIGFSNLTAHGGFLATGWRGVWMAMVFVIFSYIGTEVVAVTAGEARIPRPPCRAPCARMLAPSDHLLSRRHRGARQHRPLGSRSSPAPDITASPFVRVFQLIGIPAAAHIVNFVVITAALPA